MQSIFEWDFRGKAPDDLREITERNIQEFGPGLEDSDFIWRLVNGVAEHLAKIDAIIERAAPEWPIDMITAVDRNLLRLGLYELLFGNRDEVPPKVAINEAIELAKTFGSDSSSRFINGVLGTVYREIGEPGKEHPSRHEKKPETEPADPPHEKTAPEMAGGDADAAADEDKPGL